MKLKKLILGTLILSSLTSVSVLALSNDMSQNQRAVSSGTGWTEHPHGGRHENSFGSSCQIKTSHKSKIGRNYSAANGTNGESVVNTTGANAHLYQTQAFVKINGATTSSYVGRGSAYIKANRSGKHSVYTAHNGYYSG